MGCTLKPNEPPDHQCHPCRPILTILPYHQHQSQFIPGTIPYHQCQPRFVSGTIPNCLYNSQSTLWSPLAPVLMPDLHLVFKSCHQQSFLNHLPYSKKTKARSTIVSLVDEMWVYSWVGKSKHNVHYTVTLSEPPIGHMSSQSQMVSMCPLKGLEHERVLKLISRKPRQWALFKSYCSIFDVLYLSYNTMC